MGATIHDIGGPRFPQARQQASGARLFNRGTAQPAARSFETAASNAWLVDLGALARCRALFAGQVPPPPALHEDNLRGLQSLLEVPIPYDQFCRSHFASVKRLHPELSWDDACPAYAIALYAHAVLCEALDQGREQLLEAQWPRLRGQSTLEWPQARALIADGCSAMARLDPLAMHR